MNAFDGTVNMNGKYDTSLPSVPKADMNFNVNNASFRKSFESMESLQKIAPVFNNMTGRYSMSLGLKTDILPDFSPDLNSLWAKGTIKSSDVSVSGVEALDRMADLLNYDKLKTLSMKDLNLSFEIEKGRLSVNPFDIKAGTVTLTLGGSTGLDQTLDLKGKISIPSDNIRIMNMSIKNLPFTITGTVSNPNVSLDTKAMAADVATGAADKVKDIVADKLGIPTDSLSTMSPERKAEVMAEARRKADKMISDAEAEAKKLIEKAGNNPLLKIAAEKAAEKLKKEAQKQAEEVMSQIRTAITRALGPVVKFLTAGSLQNTTGARANRVKLAATKKGIENFLNGSLLEVRPMSIDKLQGVRPKVSTVDEWLSGDIREDVVGAIEQGASKMDDYLIVAVSSEGTVRNSSGDTIKMELLSILRGEYIADHVSIWYYRLDNVEGAYVILVQNSF